MSTNASVKLVLMGYVPPSQNALRGCHWSVLRKEKIRAALYLRSALRSCLSSMPFGHSIGITTDSKTFRTAVLSVDSYLQTLGAALKEPSSLVRHTRKKTSAPKLK